MKHCRSRHGIKTNSFEWSYRQCELEEGHDGPHQAEFMMGEPGYRDRETVTWPGDAKGTD